MGVALWVAFVLSLGSGTAQAFRFVPDQTFGTGGVVDLLPGNGTGGVFHEVRGVEPGPEGTVYVLYRALPGPEMYECEATRHLARLRPGGALDPGFGTDGFVTVSAPLGCRFPSLAVDEQLRPLLTWTSEGTPQGPTSTLAMTRYTAGGAPDPGFGSAGVATVQIPCPGGNGADVHADRSGWLVLSFGCLEDESAEGIHNARFHSYLARLQPNGALEAGFGSGGFLAVPLEPGWSLPRVGAVERDGSLVLWQSSDYAPTIPHKRLRLLRLRSDGAWAIGYQAKAERSLRRVAAARPGARLVPEEATDFVLRPKGGLALSALGEHGSWAIALRHDGSLDPEFSEDGHRRFGPRVRFIARDREGRLLVLGWEFGRGLTIFRLEADGSRDRSIGGPSGQRIGELGHASPAELVSLWRGRPLLYFSNPGHSCQSREDCTEPAELRRLRLAGRK